MEVTHPTYPSWRLTGFYGYPENERRRDSWDLLRTLSQDNTLPWCIMGDFNDILSNEEKRSKVNHPPWRIRGFREAVQDSNLVDLPLIGYPFTWIKGRGGDDMKEERLDRAMATQSWFDIFPNCQLHNLVASRSDHYPILLKIQEGSRRKIMREFKFENSWLYEEELEGIVQGGWEKDRDRGVTTKLKNCTNELNEWGRRLRNKYRVEIEECRNELDSLRNACTHEDSTRYDEVRRKMSMLLAQEEAFWKQRAKIYWLRDGDTNSRFFHATASARKKRNEITQMKKDDGEVIQHQHEVCEVAKNYFEQLFSPGQQGHNTMLDYIMPSITEENNNQLTSPFQIKEFKEALFAMHSDKAPGPDGLNPAFYKRFWSLCGVEIFNACVTWLEEGTFPKEIMATNIVLIPKKDNPESMKDFRPISLCNVLYKIISKVLANRLKPLLPQCISQEQSAFVENRSIIDNVMIASEIVHHMKCKTRGKKGEVALKLDISKAYDRVDWEYVKRIMRRMGFHEKWVNWISMCMESVHYQVLVNGESVGPVKPMRGLRQGDPLSPYIFIMCAEGLSGLLKQSEARGEIHGIKVCRGAPILTHLLFADDSFLFCRADEHECTKIKEILKQYEEVSGQAINLQKSEIFFSKNTPEADKETIKGIFQVIVKGGLRWCIGDGKSISVWNDPWLRKSENSYITSPLLQGGEHLKVADLMDAATCTWKWDLINAIFNDRDIREIKKMAAISGGETDHKVWKFNNKGSYTVKSAYRYSMETLIDNEGYKLPGDWMQIWNLKIPQRVKKFMWRVLRGCLPTRDKLQRKGVQCTDLCPHCETTYENEWHVFLGCEKAKRIWIEAGLWDDIAQLVVAANSFNSLVFSFMTVNLEQKCSDFVMIMWCLWKRRNEKIWEGVEKPVHLSINTAREYLVQWREIKARQENVRPAAINTQVVWQPPADGEFKCNVDAALFNEEQQFGLGMCIRGAHGTFVKARTMVFEGTPPPLEAEAYALKEALIWLEELGISRVAFVS
ncbi:hypothetical protein TSUD_166260 [Trifolium subterraneum]|uniref:Reverse transcriptase domain-containing protein n=1 Tax=Trifolium subterraneum TaxID=3900 RepID=A0A2Z6NJ54_TRISU|nr:hypothetical protein TSUD_166260 [Trifolium subterraneum]